MRLVKIGVGAVSVTVGDFAGNAARLGEVIAEARAQDVHLLVTPELAISGYSLKDRVWWPDIPRRSWESLEEIAQLCEGISVFLGLPLALNSRLYNAAAFVHDRCVRGLILKKYLPTHSIFYEGRNWSSWTQGVTECHGVPVGDLVFDTPYGRVSAEICEDLWSPQSPAHARVQAGAEIICNASASPFTPRKNEHRKRLVLNSAGGLACVYAFSNILGLDNSRIVFDGGGIIATPECIVAEGPILSPAPWTLETGVVDLDDIARVRAENSTWRQDAQPDEDSAAIRTVSIGGGYTQARVDDYTTTLSESFFVPDARAPRSEVDCYLDELLDAMVLGLRDYFEKSAAFDRFLIALSGGRDSALCLLLAVYAARIMDAGKGADPKECVHTVYLPNEAFSSDATRDAAQSLAEELDVTFKVVSISDEAKIALAKAAELAGGEDRVTPIARQNLQARIRGAMMLNWANNAKGLLLVTSNLSEAAVGYTTTGGDNEGGYAPVANLPKTLISRLLEHIAERDGLTSLKKIFAIPPSAELAEDQLDEADLMPYAILDDLLYLFAGRRMALADCWRIVCRRHPDRSPGELRDFTEKFGRLFIQSQWKREQLPVALKVLDLDLDPKTGFRFPVTQSIDDELEELAKAQLEPG
ncbi:MAG: NAD(+) synthase [Candidatus Hydrogenedentes bacterium]|nr:NAD(+) synthase [Candidatus Hydrogenedentota bacterium]